MITKHGFWLFLAENSIVTGKTYLYQMLEDLKMTEEYNAIRLFNYKTDDFHAELRKCRDKFIVIDNADTILDNHGRAFINYEKSNQYMLFLRNCDGLNLSSGSFTVLDEDHDIVTLRRELMI